MKNAMMMAAGLACVFSVASFGQDYALTVDQASSSLTSDVSMTLNASGTFIGNYDPATNPSGTQTRPGLFGGSGNQPIPYTSTINGNGLNNSSPTGGYTLTVDLVGGFAQVNGFSMDLLGGSLATIPIEQTLMFSTFHTINPSGIFIGGIPITLPVGDLTMSVLTATQVSTTSGGIVTPVGPNQYSVSVLVPVEVMSVLELSGQPVGNGLPLPAAFLVSGTLDIAGQNATLTMSVNLVPVLPPIVGPIPVATDQPVDIPTLGGGVAHLLFTSQLDSGTVDVSITGQVVSTGAVWCPVDINGDGVVDVLDFFAFIVAFNNQDPVADLNGDGFIDVLDFFAFVQAFSTGCG